MGLTQWPYRYLYDWARVHQAQPSDITTSTYLNSLSIRCSRCHAGFYSYQKAYKVCTHIYRLSNSVFATTTCVASFANTSSPIERWEPEHLFLTAGGRHPKHPEFSINKVVSEFLRSQVIVS